MFRLFLKKSQGCLSEIALMVGPLVGLLRVDDNRKLELAMDFYSAFTRIDNFCCYQCK